MKPVRSTDYFAVVFEDGPSGRVRPKAIRGEGFHRRLDAGMSLLALMLTLAIFLASVLLDGSH